MCLGFQILEFLPVLFLLKEVSMRLLKRINLESEIRLWCQLIALCARYFVSPLKWMPSSSGRIITDNGVLDVLLSA